VLKKLLQGFSTHLAETQKLEAEDASDLITSCSWWFEQRLVSFALNQMRNGIQVSRASFLF